MGVVLQKIVVSEAGSPGDTGLEAANKIYANDSAILALFPKTRTPFEYLEVPADGYYFGFDGSGPNANPDYSAVAIPVSELPSPLYATASLVGGALALVVWMNGAAKISTEYPGSEVLQNFNQVLLTPPAGATEARFTVHKAEGLLKLFTDAAAENTLLTKDDGDARYIQANVPGNNLIDKDAIVHGSGINATFDIQVVGEGEPYGYVEAVGKPLTDYTYSGNNDPNRVAFLDGSDALIGGFDPATAVPVQNAPPYHFTTPAGVVKMRVGTQSGGANTDNLLNLNEGTDVLPYEPFGMFIDKKYLPPLDVTFTGPWAGKTIVLYGDSQIANDIYPPMLAALLGCVVILRGIGGTAVTPGYGAIPAQSLNAAARLAQVEADMLTADALFICAGGNDEIDSGNGIAPIGNRNVIPNQATTPNNFYEAVKRIINYFQMSPNCKSKAIAWVGVMSNHGTAASRFDNYEQIRVFSDATADSCAQYGVPYWNSLAESGVSRENEPVYTSDGTHLNAVGAAMYARRFAGFANTRV